MNKSEILSASINHVLKLVGEGCHAIHTNRELINDILFPVINDQHIQQTSYRNLELLVVSLYHQFNYLEENFQTTFYTLNLNYLFEVKKNGITKAFVYGVGSVDEAVENTMASFNVDTGIATRYIPIINEEPWKEFIDPTLIFYDSLPIRFHYKTVYYSVAMIVVKLFGRNVAILSGTKLEAFIKRAKNSQIQKRIFSF